MKNTEETIAKYSINTNLFQLGSTNPKKISRPCIYKFLFFKNVSILISIKKKLYFYFSKLFKITLLKDAEYAEIDEK